MKLLSLSGDEPPKSGVLYQRQVFTYRADGKVKPLKPHKVRYIGDITTSMGVKFWSYKFKRAYVEATFYCKDTDWPLYSAPIGETRKHGDVEFIIYKEITDEH